MSIAATSYKSLLTPLVQSHPDSHLLLEDLTVVPSSLLSNLVLSWFNAQPLYGIDYDKAADRLKRIATDIYLSQDTSSILLFNRAVKKFREFAPDHFVDSLLTPAVHRIASSITATPISKRMEIETTLGEDVFYYHNPFLKRKVREFTEKGGKWVILPKMNLIDKITPCLRIAESDQVYTVCSGEMNRSRMMRLALLLLKKYVFNETNVEIPPAINLGDQQTLNNLKYERAFGLSLGEGFSPQESLPESPGRKVFIAFEENGIHLLRKKWFERENYEDYVIYVLPFNDWTQKYKHYFMFSLACKLQSYSHVEEAGVPVSEDWIFSEKFEDIPPAQLNLFNLELYGSCDKPTQKDVEELLESYALRYILNKYLLMLLPEY